VVAVVGYAAGKFVLSAEKVLRQAFAAAPLCALHQEKVLHVDMCFFTC
jgi:hypothetical protein